MCKVYNSVGCLTTVKAHLNRHNLAEFKSLYEVMAFQKDYENLRQNIISNAKVAIENEKNSIISNNIQLKNTIESTKELIQSELLGEISQLKSRLQEMLSLNRKSIWQKFINYFSVAALKKRIRNHELTLPSKVHQSVQQATEQYQRNEERYHFISSRFQDAVMDRCYGELNTLERKKALIDEVNSSIYGAIGEQKVVRELERLPDEYVLINDFCVSFSPPIYNRSENDRIRSIQVDHLLVAPSGVFLIETKYWSEESLNSLNLRSPVSQLKRTSFALFIVLNKKIQALGLNQHHWGKKKIALKSVLVLIGQKPVEEFQYVKALTLNQLLGYIKYFPAIYTRNETESIANELINISQKNE